MDIQIPDPNPEPVTNEPSFAPPPDSFFSKLTNAVQSFVPTPHQSASAPSTPVAKPPAASPQALRLLMKEQPPLEFKLHYFEPPPPPAKRRLEITQLQNVISNQIKPTADQRLVFTLGNLHTGELEQKGFFKIQHGYYDHYVRKFLQPNPNTWVPTDFWLKLPSEGQEMIPADLYQYDVGVVIEKDPTEVIHDATIVIYVNKEGKVGRPKSWEKKTPEELKAIARNYLVFIGSNEDPKIGSGVKNGETTHFIAVLNETDKFIRQCYISHSGYIRIDLQFK